jgi:hypothetical protein
MQSGPPGMDLDPPLVSSRPPHMSLEPPPRTSRPPTGGAQVFKPAYALGPHFLLGHGSGATMWFMDVWQKPSARSNLTAHIQCERPRCALLCTGHGQVFVRPHKHE